MLPSCLPRTRSTPPPPDCSNDLFKLNLRLYQVGFCYRSGTNELNQNVSRCVVNVNCRLLFQHGALLMPVEAGDTTSQAVLELRKRLGGFETEHGRLNGLSYQCVRVPSLSGVHSPRTHTTGHKVRASLNVPVWQGKSRRGVCGDQSQVWHNMGATGAWDQSVSLAPFFPCNARFQVSCSKKRVRFPFECRLEAWFASVVRVLTLSPCLLYVHMSFFSSSANLLALSRLSVPLVCLWFWPCAAVSLSLCIVYQCL